MVRAAAWCRRRRLSVERVAGRAAQTPPPKLQTGAAYYVTPDGMAMCDGRPIDPSDIPPNTVLSDYRPQPIDDEYNPVMWLTHGAKKGWVLPAGVILRAVEGAPPNRRMPRHELAIQSSHRQHSDPGSPHAVAPPPMPDPYSPSAMDAARTTAAARAGRSSTVLTTARNGSGTLGGATVVPYSGATLGGSR